MVDEDLGSNSEAQNSTGSKLEETRNNAGNIPMTFKLPSASFEETLARNSPRLQLARKALVASRINKHL